MDLKIKDVAELLNISENKILDLVENGKIPAYKLEGEFRFNPLEIENLISKKKFSLKELEETLDRKIGSQAFSLFRAIHKGEVIRDIEETDKNEIIKKSTDIIAKNLTLDATVLLELLKDREKLMSTGIGEGIAIPHARDFLLDIPLDVIYVVFPKKPIEYDSLDGKKVHTLFFLFASEDKKHLHLLSKIAQLSRRKESLEFLKTRPSKDSLLKYIKRWEAKIKRVF